MSDLISRQAAIDALKVAYWDKEIQSAKDDPCIIDTMTDWAIRMIKELPSADVPDTNVGESIPSAERTTGKWEYKYYTWRCSNCGANPTHGMGYVQREDELFEFCPNCGARMEVER